MKLKKVLFSITLAAVAVLSFSSCDVFTPKETPIATVSIVNGSTVDPTKFSTFDVDFSIDMDTSYSTSSVIYYNYDYTYGDLQEIKWVTPRKLRFTLYPHYGIYYKYILNDDSFLTHENNDGSYTKKKSYLRSVDGAYADPIEINFVTINSNLIHPTVFEMDLSDYLPKEVYLHENYWTDNNGDTQLNQQVMLNVKEALNHENIRRNDTVVIKFKFKSDKDISALYAQLVDVSYKVNYWSIISKKEIVNDEKIDVIVAENIKASTEDEENVYEAEATFDISRNLSDFDLVLQLWADYNPDAEDASSELITLTTIND